MARSPSTTRPKKGNPEPPGDADARLKEILAAQREFARTVQDAPFAAGSDVREPLVQFSIRIPRSTRDAIRHSAGNQGMSAQEFVLEALQAQLRRADDLAFTSPGLTAFREAFVELVRSGDYIREVESWGESDLFVN